MTTTVALDDLTDRLTQLRRELIATRVVAYGLMLMLFLGALGASRLLLGAVALTVILVTCFLGLRWGLGDTALSTRQSLEATAILAAIGGLGLWWTLG